jgi:2-dehydro-3-deoxygluconokinase
LFGLQGEPEDILLQLGRLSRAQYLVTSVSEEGLLGWDRNQIQHQPARKVEIIDRIGAGDAMIAGVLHGWLGGDFFKGLRYGALTAALALSQYGDLVITNLQELEELMESDRPDILR